MKVINAAHKEGEVGKIISAIMTYCCADPARVAVIDTAIYRKVSLV